MVIKSVVAVFKLVFTDFDGILDVKIFQNSCR